jgi:hypothetical protein
MRALILIVVWSVLLPPVQEYPLKKGKPTSRGIEQYIEEKGDSIRKEFEAFIQDTLHNVWIYAQDLSGYLDNDSLELGWYYPNEIFITTAEMFVAYELADLSRVQRVWASESNKFVKSTVVHELTHNYIHQISLEMRSLDSIRVHKAYHSNLWILNQQESFGRSFIEEGLCEYMTEQMGEIMPSKRIFVPESMEDLMDDANSYELKYKYSTLFLKPFLEGRNFKRAVKILLHNPPPTFAEILEPDLYFNRLISID